MGKLDYNHLNAILERQIMQRNILQTQHDDEVTTLANGFNVRMSPLPEIDRTTIAAIRFQNATEAVNAYGEKSAVIVQDTHLSAEGKNAKLQPLAVAAINELAHNWSGLGAEELHFTKRMDVLYQVPVVDSAVQVAIDIELRHFWREQGMEAMSKLISRMATGPKLARLELALLRGPLAGIDPMLDAVTDSWQRGCRTNNPAEVSAIAAGLATVAWSRRGLQQLAPALLSMMRQTVAAKNLVLHTVAHSQRETVRNGGAVFGLTPELLAETRRVAGLKAA